MHDALPMRLRAVIFVHNCSYTLSILRLASRKKFQHLLRRAILRLRLPLFQYRGAPQLVRENVGNQMLRSRVLPSSQKDCWVGGSDRPSRPNLYRHLYLQLLDHHRIHIIRLGTKRRHQHQPHLGDGRRFWCRRLQRQRECASHLDSVSKVMHTRIA